MSPSARYLLFSVFLFASAFVAAGSIPVLQWNKNHLAVIDRESGVVRWSLDTQASLFEPVMQAGMVFVTARTGLLRATDATTGALRWQFKTKDDWVYPPAVMDGRLVLVGRQSGLHGLSAADGRVLWHLALAHEPTYAPLVLNEHTIAQGLFDGEVLAIDPLTGRLIWRTSLTTPPLNMSTDGRQLLVGGYDNGLQSLSVPDGHIQWSSRLPGRVMLPPIPRGAYGLVATDVPSLVSVDLKSGQLLGQVALAGDAEKMVPLGERSARIFIKLGKKTVSYRVSISRRSKNPVLMPGSLLNSYVTPKDTM